MRAPTRTPVFSPLPLLSTLAAVGLLAAGACGPGEPEVPGEAAPLTPKVLVIGIDGIRVDVLAEVPTPNLDALASEGTFSAEAQTGRPTVSGPGWSSMLIGVWPEKHGVHSNDFTGNRYDVHRDFLTRIEDVRPELETFAVVDWAPLGNTTDGGPVISDRIDTKYVLDGYVVGWETADSLSVEEALRALRTGDPDALFVYLGNPDETSHHTGSTFGPEYRASIQTADRMVGRLVEAVRTRPTYAQEDWLILSSTDHGRNDTGGHGGDSIWESTIYFIASGPSALRGEPSEPPNIVDVAVTALAHLGIPLDPAWDLDGKVVGISAGGSTP
jgi:arylsulfatase A-like enzyme